MRPLIVTIVGVILFLTLAVAILADLVGAFTLAPAFLVSVCLIGGIVAGLGWVLTRSRWVFISIGVFAVSVAALRFADLNPRKPFREFYSVLKPGMSQHAVLEALYRRFPASGRFRQPVIYHSAPGNPERLQFTLDPNDGAYNSEFVVAHFAQGILVSSEYLPD